MENQATHAHVIKYEDSFKIADSLWQVLKSDESVEAMLLVYSKEMNQMFLFPIKDKKLKVVKITCALAELTPDFVQDLTMETATEGLEKVHVTGVTTNEDGILVFEGYYCSKSADLEQLEKNIGAHPNVSSCTVTTVE